MPRFSGKKPYHQELISRQVGEIRALLHALEMREGLDEAENRPRMDMYESSDEVVLEFDLPGFRLEDIAIRVNGVTLVLEAHKPREQIEGCFICMERSFGHFNYVIQLPGIFDPRLVVAEYRLGVLRVVCPKAADLKVPIKEITL
ncbi:Hsp20/alpha crystallin family protein [Geobacter sp. SVR]|uniref:Hsp20/alpha crystallin family protein n=1 Tax=Geobacter sp. SVR TaxID=2495594 RepID=UPI00143F0139|nr:Hsp20/alpha crystallin family protein [Geobacter sp. SVR]BCS55113.1 molecular chaperone [Geobacter sp. SVR]GCF85294.1 molecular chaperone [Geobacter sp. SVR]